MSGDAGEGSLMGTAVKTTSHGRASNRAGAQARCLLASCIAGGSRERARWSVADGGLWDWRPAGVRARGGGAEWASLRWDRGRDAPWRTWGNFLIEVSITGKAEAAGLSFGPYKDFLADLDSEHWPRRLQLEVDAERGLWSFRIDGRLAGRRWWNDGVRRVEDLLGGQLHLKARGVESVLFHNLTVHRFEASCRLSVIITCHRFLQRLRVSLHNWCHQTLPAGALEIVVVNPQSPDGTHEHLAAVAHSYPSVRVRELPVGPELAANKGAMINRALSASSGDLMWLTDADCLFPPGAAAEVLERVGNRRGVFYGRRRHLSGEQTAALLSGRLDGVRDFDELARRRDHTPADDAPWGYTQIAPREVLEHVGYTEQFDHYAGSDNQFILDCRRRGVRVERLPRLFCLHLSHPFSWYGAGTYL